MNNYQQQAAKRKRPSEKKLKAHHQRDEARAIGFSATGQFPFDAAVNTEPGKQFLR
jgi:hypothetical protein